MKPADKQAASIKWGIELETRIPLRQLNNGLCVGGYDGLRVLQHTERLRAVLRGKPESIAPVTVELWPSLSCNARCPTCPYRLSDARAEADRAENLFLWPISEAERILVELAQAGVNSVIFTGGGEPLLHPEISRMIRCAKKAGLRWALFTNGHNLDRALAAELLALEPDFFRVSLDAGDPEEYGAVYGARPEQFFRVVTNVIGAATTAAKMRFRGFGLSYTLDPTASDADLHRIAQMLVRIDIESGGGLGFAAFRPRIIHYRGTDPLFPQPFAGQFGHLGDRITTITAPHVERETLGRLRIDVKKGLFHAADASLPPARSVSGGWMTNIDHRSVGYACAELTGSSFGDYVWGSLTRDESFLDAWFGRPQRRAVHRRLSQGELKLAVVHRTLPVDSLLQAISESVALPLEDGIIQEAIDLLAVLPFYKSRNVSFV